MGDDKKFGAMVDVCLKANAAVVETGTPAMIAMTRALLWQLGQEAAQREARAEEDARPPPGGRACEDGAGDRHGGRWGLGCPPAKRGPVRRKRARQDRTWATRSDPMGSGTAPGVRTYRIAPARSVRDG